jgi:hypothetical protein
VSRISGVVSILVHIGVCAHRHPRDKRARHARLLTREHAMHASRQESTARRPAPTCGASCAFAVFQSQPYTCVKKFVFECVCLRRVSVSACVCDVCLSVRVSGTCVDIQAYTHTLNARGPMEALDEARDQLKQETNDNASCHGSSVACCEHAAMPRHGIMLSSAHLQRVCRVQEARTEKRDTDEVRNLVFDLFRESALWNFKVSPPLFLPPPPPPPPLWMHRHQRRLRDSGSGGGTGAN